MNCGAPKTNGQPCSRQVKAGFTRCNLHGGANPAAKIKAEQMLAQARLPACEVLYDIIDRFQADTCTACGHPSGNVDDIKAVTRAAQIILDRTGLGPRATIEVTRQADGDLDFDLLTENEMAQLDYLLGQVSALKVQIHARLNAVAHALPAPSLTSDESSGVSPISDGLPDVVGEVLHSEK